MTTGYTTLDITTQLITGVDYLTRDLVAEMNPRSAPAMRKQVAFATTAFEYARNLAKMRSDRPEYAERNLGDDAVNTLDRIRHNLYILSLLYPEPEPSGLS